MLRTVHFHGALKRKFNRSSIKLDADSVAEAMRGLSILLPGFTEYVRDRQYVVTAANENDSMPLEPEALLLNLGKRKHIHIIPAAQAAGIETFLIVGLVLVATAAIAAVMFMRPKVPTANSREKNDQSFIFNGATNSTEQGHPVPLIYGGPIRVGSIVVSGGITTTDIGTSTYNPTDPGQPGNGYVGSTPGVTTPTEGSDFWQVARPIMVEAVANKGGKGGGGGGTRSAEESPNTLRSQSTVRMVELLGEGEIGGLVHGLKSVYLDNTPVQNEDGSFNFAGFSLEQRIGLPDQDPMPGHSQQESGVEVGADVKFNFPIVRTVSDPVVDVVRVTLGLNALFEQDTTNGDLKPSQVAIAIDYQSNGGGYTQVVHDVITGKTNSPYQRSYDVRLSGEAPHNIRVRRLTPDSELASLKNEVRWDTMFEVVEAKLTYPDSALVGITVDAMQFGSSIPDRSYEVNGLVIDVPSNYDPIARTYSGIWDGTFKRAITNNPAWVFYDIVKNKRYGLGKRVPIGSVDKYGLYAVAQYCDGLISDGKGGMQPRYTINTVVNTPVSAYNLLMSIGSAFRGFIYWGSNSVVVAQDRPEDPSVLVTPSNVIDGRISYKTNIDKQKLRSVAIVYWNNPADNYKLTPEIVEDPVLIKRMGWEPGEAIVRFGCTNRAEAHYAAKWILEDQENANKSVHYEAADDHSFVRPGTVISVADPKFTAGRRGGRVRQAQANEFVIDFPVTLVSGPAYYVRVMLPDGKVSRRQVLNVAGTHDTLVLGGAAWSPIPEPGSVWALESNTVVHRQFRVRNIGADEPPYPVIASLYDPNSHARVEEGLDLPPDNFLELPGGPLEVPSGLAIIEYLLNDGTSSVPSVMFSWSSATDPRIMFYQARYKRPGGEWESLEDGPALARTVRNSEAGVWEFMVRAVTATGQRTAWALGSASLDGLADTLPEVIAPGITIDAGLNAATLIWDKPNDIRPLRYEVMYSVDEDYGTAVSLGVTDQLSFPITMAGNYWVRTTFLVLKSQSPEMVTATALVVSGTVLPYLSNEAANLPADKDGNVLSYALASGTYKIMSGGEDVSDQFTLSTPVGGNLQALAHNYNGRDYFVTGGFDANEPGAQLRIRATGLADTAFEGVRLDKDFTLAKAQAGQNGTSGLSSAVVEVFQRSASVPAKPSSVTTYTFATGVITGLNNGWSPTPPEANGQPLYIAMASASSSGPTDTIGANEWTDAILAQNADGTGANGINSATVYIFQRALSAPPVPNGSQTYTFATGGLTGLNNGWSRSVPAGPMPLFVSLATAASSAATDTISSGEWAAPEVMARDGAQGPAGTNNATITIYQRAGSTPAKPSATITYTFATGAVTGLNNGWSTTPPASNGLPLYASQATASSPDATDNIAGNEWADPFLLVQDGSGGSGSNGINSASIYLYRRVPAGTGTPAVPAGTIVYTFSTGAATGIDNGWSRTIPPGSDPIWVTTATAAGTGATDNIASSEWAAPAVLAQNGGGAFTLIPHGTLSYGSVGVNRVDKNGTGTGAYNFGAYTSTGFRSGAQCTFRVKRTPGGQGNFAAGLNSDPATNADYTSIDYQWILGDDGGNSSIFENSVFQGIGGGPWNESTDFQVQYDNDVVRWLKDGTVIYSKKVSADLLLYFDSAILYPNSSITDITFTAGGASGKTPITFELSAQAMTVAASNTGVTKSGQLPKQANVTVRQGPTIITQGISAGLTYSSPALAGDFIIVDNQVVFRLLTADASGWVDVEVAVNNVLIGKKRIAVTRVTDPTAPGSVKSANKSFNGASVFNTTAYPATPQIGTLIMPAGPSGTLYVNMNYTFSTSGGGTTQQHVKAKAVYRVAGSGASYSDFGPSVQSTGPASANSAEPLVGEGGLSQQLGGLTAGQQYEIAVVFARAEGQQGSNVNSSVTGIFETGTL